MPLPMMVPMTIAVPCHTLSSRGSSRRALVMSNSRGEKACGVSDGKGHNGSKSNVPGPRDAYAKQIVGCVGRKPQKNIHQESAGHPDECAACIRTFGQDAEQKNSEHGTVGDGSNREPKLQYASSAAREQSQAEKYASPHTGKDAREPGSLLLVVYRAPAQIKIHHRAGRKGIQGGAEVGHCRRE